MNTKEKSYDIVNGPGKDLMFDACKYAYSKQGISVAFTIAMAYTVSLANSGRGYIPMKAKDFIINGIRAEDSSGESFVVEGYCKADLVSLGDTANFQNHSFWAYYNTKTRTGRIRFE